ncbi:IS1595 family transposase [Sphingomonas radiodurans]|uniref:IS1595 family transposase n=1 Tax=Sphingomonas radiodurans TaxID=2890321 RepID=UPI001E2BB344|nr:IS1595 family transposase [Sphingomonas radiodurans]WBH18048.1 IS1595 family transposase [Sphingomonas radiodurans]
MTDLTNPIYHDANKAREHLEALHWPHGPVCPRCGTLDRITKLAGKSTRPGVYKCNECAKPFTVTVCTVFEDSKIPLNKWLLAFRLLNGAKKGFSAHELHRSLGITYKSAWFLMHRIRTAMEGAAPTGPLGGAGGTVEVDETYVGGKAKNRAHRKPAPKKAVVALVERNGNARSFHVANVTAKDVRPLVVSHIDRASFLMTDESPIYTCMGKEFAGHATVNHSAGEYVSLKTLHSNTVENFFSIFKRGVIGTYHHMSEAHLGRYCAEFDFRYNTREISDAERSDEAVRGARGHRLMYRQPSPLAA